jgi:hypothetical protein
MRHLSAAVLAALLGLAGMSALAQEHQHTPGMEHMAGMDMSAPRPSILPREGGQAEFAALGEISNMLQADPKTDWSKVDLTALRAHLIDMDNVMMRASVVTTPVPGGARFDISGDDEAVRRSIQHMVASHTAMTDGDGGRHEVSAPTLGGATMTVTGQGETAAAEIRALGFFGLLTGGTHHQLHHLMMAKGEMRH